MELQCDICYVDFDLDLHRPKSLPCGHTICKECVQNPELGRRCPTCRKDLPVDLDDLPDTILAIRLIENGGVPPRKKPRGEDSDQQRLQRGVDAGRKVVEALRLAVPKAVEALNRQLDASVAQLLQLEEALEQQVQRNARDDGGTPPPPVEQLQLAVQLEDSLRLLTTNECSVVAEEEDGPTWKAALQLGGFGDILRMLLLQLRADGQLQKVADVAVPAAPAAYVGPPMTTTLTMYVNDFDEGRLEVDDILRDERRWKNARAIRGLQGRGSDKLLRVLAPQLPHLEELDILGEVEAGVMEQVGTLSSLKRLKVQYDWDLDYPDLPLQLEELSMAYVRGSQLRRVLAMPGLRSLFVKAYSGPNISFAPSQHGSLLWLRVAFHSTNKSTMLSFIGAFASSLQSLQFYSPVNDKKEYNPDYYHPDLGRLLAACGLRALRRLVLERPTRDEPCTEIAACLLQQQTLRSSLPSSVEVVCGSCHAPLFCPRAEAAT
ncbi:uncharacterized protein LOC113213928 isoform X2 [Frankliniella occidentalis]|nr:uncharacterized protein LOC113213928 isoform X2 [Frankliniella occidentalis]XP_052121212.1 uncharacterized protein LOC113213928 isoform X2 [Frankliniella occidentalis]XP_052121213.1 uncharacterized protein LOC113213928 isoform X2 [Frankliniella occidentalis]